MLIYNGKKSQVLSSTKKIFLDTKAAEKAILNFVPTINDLTKFEILNLFYIFTKIQVRITITIMRSVFSALYVYAFYI